MKKATFFTSTPYFNNRQFDINDKELNRDNCLFPFFALREALKTRGIDLSTQDINKNEESEVVIFNDMPSRLPQKRSYQKYYLIALESVAINPRNYDRSLYGNFEKVFTWHDDLVNGNTVVKINYSFDIAAAVDHRHQNRQRLICHIANNKGSEYPGELYSERRKAIRWFEKNHPEDFDLYGSGWNRYTFQGLLTSLNRFDQVRKLFNQKYSSWRGQVKVKNEILSQYRFSICYENIKDIPGYITEKIFDSLFAGCVPIYLGANNITDYVPEGCFVNKRKFMTYEELYDYVTGMDEREYSNYINEIRMFLTGSKSKPFSADHFADTVTRGIIE